MQKCKSRCISSSNEFLIMKYPWSTCPGGEHSCTFSLEKHTPKLTKYKSSLVGQKRYTIQPFDHQMKGKITN